MHLTDVQVGLEGVMVDAHKDLVLVSISYVEILQRANGRKPNTKMRHMEDQAALWRLKEMEMRGGKARLKGEVQVRVRVGGSG